MLLANQSSHWAAHDLVGELKVPTKNCATSSSLRGCRSLQRTEDLLYGCNSYYVHYTDLKLKTDTWINITMELDTHHTASIALPNNVVWKLPSKSLAEIIHIQGHPMSILHRTWDQLGLVSLIDDQKYPWKTHKEEHSLTLEGFSLAITSVSWILVIIH